MVSEFSICRDKDGNAGYELFGLRIEGEKGPFTALLVTLVAPKGPAFEAGMRDNHIG